MIYRGRLYRKRVLFSGFGIYERVGILPAEVYERSIIRKSVISVFKKKPKELTDAFTAVKKLKQCSGFLVYSHF